MKPKIRMPKIRMPKSRTPKSRSAKSRSAKSRSAKTRSPKTRSPKTHSPKTGTIEQSVLVDAAPCQVFRALAEPRLHSAFAKSAPPSRLELGFARAGARTRLTMVQCYVPSSQLEKYRSGWSANYWDPLTKYFDARRAPHADN
jgi:hypothetical protein